MHFGSDNWAGAHPRISENLVRNSDGFAAAYGTSALDKAVDQRFNEIFEREVAVFFVATGTAANSLALASVNRPGGVSFCHREAHVRADECGAPEFLTGGSRLQPIDGELGRMDPEKLRHELKRFHPASVHTGQSSAVSITQSTEIGTIYALDDIAAIASICREHDLPLHMDGARFANALVTLGCSPADMTWRQGVDIVSFGGTKNGCWCAEALVFMNPSQAKDLPFIRKRSAQLFSKSRFIAAQFDAYFQDNLWIELAAHSNAMATRLASHIRASAHAALAWEPQANEVFAIMKKSLSATLQEKGAVLYDWPAPQSFSGPLADDETLVRLVTSFATTADETDQFGRLLG